MATAVGAASLALCTRISITPLITSAKGVGWGWRTGRVVEGWGEVEGVWEEEKSVMSSNSYTQYNHTMSISNDTKRFSVWRTASIGDVSPATVKEESIAATTVVGDTAGIGEVGTGGDLAWVSKAKDLRLVWGACGWVWGRGKRGQLTKAVTDLNGGHSVTHHMCQ